MVLWDRGQEVAQTGLFRKRNERTPRDGLLRARSTVA